MPGKPDDTVNIQHTWYVSPALTHEPYIVTCEPETLAMEPQVNLNSSHE